MQRIVRLNNFRTDCFATVYQSRRVISDTIIDKLFYDFDNGTHKNVEEEPKCYEDIIKMHEVLLENNYAHRIHFSGRGFHCFVYTVPFVDGSDFEKSNLLVACHNHFTNMGIELDKQVGKDLARMFRLPNTWNLNGQRYCIPLDEEMLYSGYKNIQDLAKNPHNSYTVFGSDLFDIESVGHVNTITERVKVNIQENVETKFLLPCAQCVINMEHPGHFQKVALVYELKKVFSLGQDCNEEELIIKIDNFIWNNCKWIDLNNETITKKHIRYTVRTPGVGYSCKSKKELGICVDNCVFDKIKI